MADWTCTRCDFLIYGHKAKCNKCGSERPATTGMPTAPPRLPVPVPVPGPEVTGCGGCAALLTRLTRLESEMTIMRAGSEESKAKKARKNDGRCGHCRQFFCYCKDEYSGTY